MRQHFSSFYSRITVALLVVMVVVIAGCQSGNYSGPSALKTSQGVVAEAFLPKDSVMLMKIGGSDRAQQTQFDRLLARFPTEASENFKKEIVEGFNQELAKYQMTYEADFKPVIGDHFQMLISFAGMPVQTPDSELANVPHVGVVIQVGDGAKAEAFLNKMVENNVFKKEVYGSHALYHDEKGDGYAVLVKDALFVSGNLEDAKAGLDRYAAFEKNSAPNSDAGSMIQDVFYQKALAKAPASVGFVYVNMQKLLGVISNDPTAPEESKQLLNQMAGGKEIIDALQGEILGLAAEDKGFRIFANAFGDDALLKKANFSFDMFGKHDPYLYQKLPTEKAIVYSEGYGLKQILDYDLKIWSGIPEIKQGIDDMKQVFKDAGLDFDNDVLAIFDKGFAFVFQDGGSLIPSVGLYSDVSGHPEGGQKLMAKLDELFLGLIALGNKQVAANATTGTKTPDMFVHGTAQVAGGKAYTVKLNIDELMKLQTTSGSTAVFALLKDLQLWYGVTSDNMAFVTIHPDFDKAYGGKNLAQNETFKATMSQLRAKDTGFMYVSPQSLVAYLDKVMALIPLAGGSSSSTDSYNSIRQYLDPIKGMIFGTSASANEATIDGFVSIPEPTAAAR